MDQYCRVCMVKNPSELISLFQMHESEDDVIANMIIDCTEVMVSDDDNLPHNICAECLVRLNQAYELRKQCQQSDEAFRAILLKGVASFEGSVQVTEQTSEHVRKIEVEESGDMSEMVSLTSDHSNAVPVIPEEDDINEEQNVEYLDEDEDYHEYIGSRMNIDAEFATVNSCTTRADFLPDPQFVDHVEEFAYFSIYHLRGKRCCGCHMIFPDIASLSNHCLKEHCNEKLSDLESFKCDVCFKQFRTKLFLRKHKQAGKNNILYHCKLCNAMLQDELSFMKHILSAADHDQTIDFINAPDKFKKILNQGSRCCGCDIICQNETDLEIHIAETHHPNTTPLSGEGALECSKCFKRFHQQVEFLQHTSEPQHCVYRCCIGECRFTTIHKRQILKHITVANNHRQVLPKQEKSIVPTSDEIDNEQRYACCFSRCYEIFDSYEELELHTETMHELLRIQHTQDQKPTHIICQICSKGFESKQAYNRHRSSDKAQKHVCRKCGAKYVSKSTLVQHERSNCGKVAQYQCPECDKTFMSLGGFRNHQEVHSNKRSYVCEICGRGFLRKGILKDHMKSVHSKTRLFQCTLCPKAFTSRNVFQSHQMTHTKEKPYQCRHCEKRYYKTSDRTMHENQVHLGIRPFKCSFCTASFIRDRERRLHERTHTKAKLYSCDICSEGYNKFAEYKAHRFSVHGLETLRDLGPVAMAAVHGEQENGSSQQTECKLEIEVFDLAV